MQKNVKSGKIVNKNRKVPATNATMVYKKNVVLRERPPSEIVRTIGLCTELKLKDIRRCTKFPNDPARV